MHEVLVPTGWDMACEWGETQTQQVTWLSTMTVIMIFWFCQIPPPLSSPTSQLICHDFHCVHSDLRLVCVY